jgi:RNA polymerase sigma factor (sigma-70 family)
VPTRPVRLPSSVPQAMDEQAFALLIEPHRRALHLHCYRMLGSLHDADDAVQETMLRAWKSSDRYAPRARLTTWLHAIATNVCLTAIERRRKRPAEVIEDLEHLQPYPDRLLDDLVERETVELAFITAIQLLSPKQRAVLILRDVLGWSAQEAASAEGGASVFDGGSMTNSLINDNHVHASASGGSATVQGGGVFVAVSLTRRDHRHAEQRQTHREQRRRQFGGGQRERGRRRERLRRRINDK